MAESLDFAGTGKVKADIELQPLSASTRFLRLAHGDVAARVVIDYGKAGEGSKVHVERTNELVHA